MTSVALTKTREINVAGVSHPWRHSCDVTGNSWRPYLVVVGGDEEVDGGRERAGALGSEEGGCFGCHREDWPWKATDDLCDLRRRFLQVEICWFCVWFSLRENKPICCWLLMFHIIINVLTLKSCSNNYTLRYLWCESDTTLRLNLAALSWSVDRQIN